MRGSQPSRAGSWRWRQSGRHPTLVSACVRRRSSRSSACPIPAGRSRPGIQWSARRRLSPVIAEKAARGQRARGC
eukprot:6629081-Pyramimonas_sp.AAC.1